MIKKVLKLILIVLVAGLIVIQFFQISKINPPTVEGETIYSAVAVQSDVRAVLERSCADCHSHSTKYPWYANIQPSGWFLKDHIDEGRQKINFSTFATYTLKKQAHKLEEVCEQIEKRRCRYHHFYGSTVKRRCQKLRASCYATGQRPKRRS
ncbi:MAG: heme-binding domain-containing protein [Chloracidobacterium sp.]|nr:heme-binding domain-containing protein [Chloracidobacterium sp.]